MKLAALCAGALLCASAAPAPTSGPGTRVFAGMPPERFQGEGVAVVVFVEDVTRYCGQPLPGKVIIACSLRKDNVPVMVLPSPCPIAKATGDFYAVIACHELSHSAHNWPGDHPL